MSKPKKVAFYTGKAGKKKPKSGAKILDKFLTEDINLIKTSCDIKGLALKDLRWKLTLDVHTILDRSFYRYDIKLAFDEDPFQRSIKRYQDERELLQNESALMKNIQRINELDILIADTTEEMELKRDNCPAMEFAGSVSSVKYKGNITQVELLIADNIIELLNQTKTWFSYYRLELRPEKG